MTHTVDFTAPDFHINPFPYYVRLRQSNPVCQVEPGGIWAVFRYDDVQYVLKHPEIFSSKGYAAAWLPPWLDVTNPLAESMLLLDPPDHTKLRNLVNRAFTTTKAARLEGRIRALAGSLVERIKPGSEADFVSSFAAALPAQVIADVLGLEKRHEDLARWITTVAQISPATPPSLYESTKATLGEMSKYLYDFVESRRKTPVDDIVTDLVQAEVDGTRLTDREIVAFLYLLVAAAIETTQHLLSNSVRFLTTAPEITSLLRADPSRIPQFVEEMLRYDGPGQGMLRFTTAPAKVGDVTIPPGSLVFCVAASANRDERYFANPDQFDLTRDTHGMLQFGHGVHYCVGAPVARLEARVALEVLLSRFSGFERAPGEIAWNISIVTRGPTKMPIRFLPA